MIFPPITIIQDDRHSAKNGPLGVRITTGTRYFAATLLQEVYEGRRYMAWYWIPAILMIALALATGTAWIAVPAPIWMLLAG